MWRPDFLTSRLRCLQIILTAMVLGIVVQAFRIQLLPEPRLEQLAKRQFNNRSFVAPVRGVITDRNGEPLAMNDIAYSVASNPKKMAPYKHLVFKIAAILKISPQEIKKKLEKKKDFIWLKRHISQSEYQRLQKYLKPHQEKKISEALWLVQESNRIYPHQSLAAHVLGSVNIDHQGIDGMELWANALLKGNPIIVPTVRDALGRFAFFDANAIAKREDGVEIRLTLDFILQHAIESSLREAIEKTHSSSGTVIVMDVENGDILAMANEPTFNPSERSVPSMMRRNRAITDGYEPGSTIKPLLLAAALESGSLLSDMLYGEKGQWLVQGKKITEAEAHEKFEWITLADMIRLSSNVVAAKCATQLGPELFNAFLRKSGFGTKTGITFPGEISGKIPAIHQWTPLTTATIGFGHGLMVTPLQLLSAFAMFVNGGFTVRPRLVLHPKLERAAPVRVISSTTANQVLKALLLAVQDGTGKKAQLPGYDIFGKTGTSQMVDFTTKRYSKKHYVASFVGSALDLKPQVIIFAALWEPQGNYYASHTAVPLFKNVLQNVLQRYGISPKTSDTPQVLAALETHTPEDEPILESPPSCIDPPPPSDLNTMPSLVGLSLSQGLFLLKDHWVDIRIKGFPNHIIRQSPLAGRNLKDVKTIDLECAP